MAGACEHGNETLGSKEGMDFFYQLNDCQILMKDSTPCR
jgi:hypothetical protein